MKRIKLFLIVAAIILGIGSYAGAAVLFEDNFDVGRDPAWHDWYNVPIVENGMLKMPGVYDTGVHMSSVDGLSIADEVVSMDVTMQDMNAIGARHQFGLLLRFQSPSTHIMAAYYSGFAAIYFDEMINGVRNSQLGKLGNVVFSGPVHMTAAVIGDTAYLLATDGVNSYSTSYAGMQLSDAGSVAIYKDFVTTYADNFKVETAGAGTGTLSGKVSDNLTGAAVANAIVESINLSDGSVGLSTTTGSDGTYTLSGIPSSMLVGVRARHSSYLVGPVVKVFVADGGSQTQDLLLDPVSMDIARAALATASSTLEAAGFGPASSVNDGNSGTGWMASAGPAGEWVQLAWSDNVSVSRIAIDSAGPIGDYDLKYSTNGTDWTLAKNVTSSEVGHPHWIEIVDLPSPITMKYLQLVINSETVDPTAKIYSIECYMPAGSVVGAVKDSTGAPVADATVFVTEIKRVKVGSSYAFVRGAGRLPIKGTTDASGIYDIPTPEGKVLVTAAANDSFTVSSDLTTVDEGVATTVPDLVITTRVPASVSFQDDFNDIPDGQVNPRWTLAYGADWSSEWTGSGGMYLSGATDTLGASVVLANGVATRDGVFDMDLNGFNSAIVTRYADLSNVVRLNYFGGSVSWSERSTGATGRNSASITPALDNKDLDLSSPIPTVHMHGVVVGDKCQGFVSDAWNTYWTDVFTLENRLETGAVGIYHTGGATSVPVTYDNFTVAGGSGVTAPPVGPGAAKAGGPGWYGSVAGTVTALFTDYNKLIVEDPSRSSAIVVSPLPSTSLTIGDEVVILGKVRADGTFKSVDVIVGGHNELDPVGVNNRDIIGAVGNAGLSNVDLLVKTYGTVLDTPAVFPDGSTRFHVTDGTALPGSATVPIPGQLVSVFEDNFDTSKRPEWHDYGPATYISGGMLKGDSWAITLIDGLTVENPVASIDIPAGNQDQVGLLLRAPDEGTFILANWYPGGARLYFHERVAGNWGAALGTLGGVSLPGPVHMTAEARGSVGILTATDGTNTYTTSTPLTKLLTAGRIGIFFGGQTVGLLDNFLAYERPGVDVLADAVQVAIPASVTGTISVAQGDYVKVSGIAGKGSTLKNNIRSVMIRRSDDLTN
ncbi:MAG: discoidin domain-containing protein [Armatimonadetes bacterium]|nr:discoidin domain-containing protein [Armatimonadota bacterium]